MTKTSIWRAKAESSDFKPLYGELSADVVIIGGGITGITAAYLLRRSGLKVLVLERCPLEGAQRAFQPATSIVP